MENGDGKIEAGKRNPIKSYKDLEVYQVAYWASIEILLKIIPKLPKEEKFDLADQLRRSCKAVPRLIAEGYAKKHQYRGFHKYLDDSMAEANETSVSLCQCKDAYPKYIDPHLCEKLISTYDRVGKQLFRLRQVWKDFRSRQN
ncbi:hypothetical protein A2291_00805 [candidate division WOR-1 bacterium RIFOXYB2_FULL_42_35]|uniref:Four helix bundle protein n=1 Tax=candidate division WOR-1 bacterium RIFOXYC2_FULL_41_25 TaxID=1802586 RepID=A0A1F4TLX2_UNCSA|nr:MAG: hypothetical protein A2247_05790 [candidate division WOR-1 bacterium RIFOXYA2_FULL_41_14]OGC23633.1 MAG: hypothetical protein A2291_00805 [candidate division WOR-1 bacterium RIFOXYB2_FULL_42_35]OGC33597.1 MAG: hypothetical protein A2462_02620 [candidate division WOR-1 bacterium RIFOXYC2_FULL_41_25]OGC41896.1 MAG: hypothetical protein A2548_05550 [candidate division WOR-1 bacterium RIFOXYD2_FULL_41_8]